ncbi:MAG: DUF58 domain-containing protein [Candidatus Hydrogenedentes bacterium]|nr:DUF58 domain-containing protein [Candidatus Hydrogenedentota bacterium]
MIAPSLILLLVTAFVIVPCGGVAVMQPHLAPVLLAVVLLTIAVAVLDAMMAHSRVRGIRILLPDVIRLTKDREGTVELQVHSEREKESRLTVGLPFPREIGSDAESLDVYIPGDVSVSRAPWLVTPTKRGNYRLSHVYYQCMSPLRLWTYSTSNPVDAEIRVYPNLMNERKYVAALFLPRGVFGIHAQRQVGQGREFEKLREYISGDGYDEIHWKATAKRGKPVTKVYQLERTQEVYVIIDTSRLSGRTVYMPASGGINRAESSSIEVTHLERFISAALILGAAAERQGDLFGLLTFGDRVRSFVRARNGRAHYNTCRDALYTLEPQIVNPDFDEVFSFIRLRLRRRALLLFLTNLDDAVLAESFVRNIEIVRRQHLALVGMITPPRVQPIFSNTGAESLDDVYRDLAGHLRWHDLRELERVLHRRGVSFSLLEHESMCGQLVTQYMDVKRRQLI